VGAGVELLDDAGTEPLPAITDACPTCGKRPRARHRRRRRPSRRLVTIMATILAGAMVAVVVPLLPRSPAPPPPVSYHTWAGGVPIGITLSALQDYVIDDHVMDTMKRQIAASKLYWHANTVRYQILQDRLVGSYGTRYAPWYMARIREVTNYALRLGLTVVLNAQTEISTGYARSEPLPDRATLAFWLRIAHYYRGNPHVVFDLFNEPRQCTWGEWYDAHQGLVSNLRARGIRNWLWVEGRWWGSTLEGVPLIHDPLHRLVYSYHHPGSPKPWQAPVSVATWDRAFGDLAKRGVPVIDGEYTNFVGSYYWGEPDVPGSAHPGRLVSAYLRYLTVHHIGMLAWSLVPGALNRDLSFQSESVEPQGAGHLIRGWFALTERGNRTHQATARGPGSCIGAAASRCSTSGTTM